MAKPVAVEGHRKDKLKHVITTDIVIGVRFREDLGGSQFDDLRDSILEKGIIQPITIDSNNNLLAGGRRMQAALQLGLPTIPAIIRDNFFFFSFLCRFREVKFVKL
mgnify:CR=1 FL=1